MSGVVDVKFIARIRGGVAVGLREGLDDNPYPDAARRRAWADGFCRAIVSRGPRKSGGSLLFHVKCRADRGRATWRADEIEVLELGRSAGLCSTDIGELLGRSARAVRIQASRLELTKGEAA